MRNIFRKLGVSSRVELARAVERADRAGAEAHDIGQRAPRRACRRARYARPSPRRASIEVPRAARSSWWVSLGLARRGSSRSSLGSRKRAGTSSSGSASSSSETCRSRSTWMLWTSTSRVSSQPLSPPWTTTSEPSSRTSSLTVHPRERGEAALQHERYRSHRVQALLEQLAAAKPLVLVLDDFHRADSASVELLGALLRRPPGAAVLIAGRSTPPDARTSVSCARAERTARAP